MSALLKEIIDATQQRFEARRAKRPASELKRQILDAPPVRSLCDALNSHPLSVIAEHKRRSPSAKEMDQENVKRAYEVYSSRQWISAISVLTNEDHFGGNIDDLKDARNRCGKRPILRKDFIIDEYQVYEARAFEADAILLMAALHADDPPRLQGLYDLARDLGMDVLVELGMGEQNPERLVEMIPLQAQIWGINSRKFEAVSSLRRAVPMLPLIFKRDPMTDLDRHRKLYHLIPSGKIAVAESGITGPDDLSETGRIGYRAALIGTAFLKWPGAINKVTQAFDTVFSNTDSTEVVREAPRWSPPPSVKLRVS